MLLTAALPARAQDQSFDVSTFMPPVDNYGLITLDSSQIYKPFRFGFGFFLHYANKPLAISELGPDGTTVQRDLVNPQWKADLSGAVAFCKYYEFGLDLPFVIYQDGTDIVSERSGPATGAFGDIRIHNKIRALDREEWPVGLAVVATLVTPSGDEDSYFGNSKVGFELKAVLDGEVGPVLFVGNLGYRVRDEAIVFESSDLADNTFQQQIDDEFLYGFGVEYRTPVEGLSALTEFRGVTLAEQPFTQRFNNPIIWNVGARYVGPYDLIFAGGLEVGLTSGYGAPPAGFYLNIGWSWDKPDRDKDTLPDEEDKCPDAPEDVDNFKDEDGCPDPDNDQDGILDTEDSCPDGAEDKDDYRDEDGCPDPDNDDDGIPDANDRCPNAAEDMDGEADADGCPDYDIDRDGLDDVTKDKCPLAAEDFDKFQDDDGCPDPDNDDDGVPDANDKCANDAEDKDGFEDEDGCPDPDNDLDGILDAADRCPLEREIINGVVDEDGCPDEGEPQVLDLGDHLELKARVVFEPGLSMLQRTSFSILDQVAATLKAHGPYSSVTVRVHTTNQGDAVQLVELSTARATIVKNYLVQRGLEPTKLEIEGAGGSSPIASNAAKSGRDKNERVEFIIHDGAAAAEEPELVPLAPVKPAPAAPAKPAAPPPPPPAPAPKAPEPPPPAPQKPETPLPFDLPILAPPTQQ
ncbi:MAG: hypothetical protein C4523_18570 [Myxococcales bacterium]|nr:MAG: hypothetical protein C4523_18570 [Myxococcales bacterium]